MSDHFESHAQGLTSPAYHAQPVTPSDTTVLERTSRAVYVGMAGSLKVEMASGDVVILNSVLAGSVYPLRVRRVYATGTTAADIVSLS